MKRSTVGLVGVLGALIVIAYLVTLKQGETSVDVAEGDLLAEIDSAAVERIAIRSSEGDVTLEKRGPEWYITAPLDDKADPTPIGTALQSASAMRVKGIVSTKTEKHALFQVDTTGTMVTFHQSGKDPVTIVVGKGSSSFSETYVRREESEEVALVDGSLSWTFSKPVKDWRSRSILNLPSGSVTSIRSTFRDTVVTTVFEDSIWTVNGKMANQSSVTSLVTSLSALQGEDFLDSPPGQRPSATISVSGVTVTFVYNAADKKYYANRSDDDRWLVLSDWRANQILKREKDLL